MENLSRKKQNRKFKVKNNGQLFSAGLIETPWKHLPIESCAWLSFGNERSFGIIVIVSSDSSSDNRKRFVSHRAHVMVTTPAARDIDELIEIKRLDLGASARTHKTPRTIHFCQPSRHQSRSRIDCLCLILFRSWSNACLKLLFISGKIWLTRFARMWKNKKRKDKRFIGNQLNK